MSRASSILASASVTKVVGIAVQFRVVSFPDDRLYRVL
jgi:hypothetical protein